MQIHYKSALNASTQLVILPFLETESEISFKDNIIDKKLFSGKKDTQYILEKNGKYIIFIGLGKELNYKSTKTIFRRLSSKLSTYFEQSATIFFSDSFTLSQIEAAISGLILGTYKLGHYKKEQNQHPLLKSTFDLEIVSSIDIQNTVEKAIKIANAQLETLLLVDLPPNKVTPLYLSNWARESGKKYGFEVTVFGKNESTDLNLGAFIAVGKGSVNEPQFIILDYNPKNAGKHIGLVGKGITFDTGGLNIKTAGMLHMKCDMAGGAAVLGAIQLIADLKLPFRITAIVPACENAVDSNSFMPSDVIQSYSGHSIEIIDTDAEGRLILADGISYLLKNYNPETIIDLATLTGSAVGTFGYECAALFSNNPELSKALQQSGDEIGERMWQLPLWDEYKQDIESEIADVKNYSGKPVAGAISAAKFLEFFTANHTSWAHLDIAGVAFIDDEFAKTKHASAFGVHLLSKFIENL